MNHSLDGPLLEGNSPEEVVLAYHERTKHHFGRFARSPGALDWATQPDPFRRYEGAPLVRLPLAEPGRALPYWQLYLDGGVEPQPLSMGSLSIFFRYALSLTAWKRMRDTTWSLRANPSSGNLHPTEGYAVLPPLDGLHDGPAVHHYAPKEHGLERRADLDRAAWSALTAALPEASFFVGLSSIHWREAWKYGERAFRYCQHDVGHALAAIRLSAAALGWHLVLLTDAGDADVSKILGLDRDADYERAEREHPDLVAVVTPARTEGSRRLLSGPAGDALRAASVGSWQGKANPLSPAHRADWPIIEEVARATHRAPGPPIAEDLSRFPTEDELFAPPVRSGLLSAEKVILGRRSAVSMDGTTSIPVETFFRMLARLVPTRDRRSVPWNDIPWKPRIHLGLFVHRVRGLPPGLYALARDPDKVEPLRGAMRSDFLWQRPEACPPGLPLYLLQEGGCRALAAQLSCGQDIAGDGAFSLGMIAEYTDSLRTYGAPFYPNPPAGRAVASSEKTAKAKGILTADLAPARQRACRRPAPSDRGSRGLAICSGSPGPSARCCISKQNRQAFARPASAATSTTRSTRSSVSPETGRAFITSRSGAPSKTRGSRACLPTTPKEAPERATRSGFFEE